jgi:tight adherence protein B
MSALPPVALAAAAAAVAMTSVSGSQARLAAVAAARPRRLPPLAVIAPLPLAAYVLAGVPGLVASCLVVAVASRSAQARRRATDLARERSRALDALSLLAADLDAGRTPEAALGAAAEVACGPTGDAFAAAACAARLGGDVAAALLAPPSAVAEVMRGLAACWQVCTDAGAGLARAVDRLADGQRAAAAQRRSLAAELAGPRATAQLLAVLPVGGIGLAAALGAHPLQFLLHTPVGLGCLSTGMLMDAAGVLWTRRLTDGALP